MCTCGHKWDAKQDSLMKALPHDTSNGKNISQGTFELSWGSSIHVVDPDIDWKMGFFLQLKIVKLCIFSKRPFQF